MEGALKLLNWYFICENAQAAHVPAWAELSGPTETSVLWQSLCPADPSGLPLLSRWAGRAQGAVGCSLPRVSVPDPMG